MTRVWSQDGKGQDKSVFLPGDPIRYTAVVNNTYTHPVKATIRFEALGPVTSGPNNPAGRSIYLYKQDIEVPAGQSAYYSPINIPVDAQPGKYVIDVGLTWDDPSNRSNPACGGQDPSLAKLGCRYGLQGLFSIPGTLATDITTYLTDRGTPTSVPDRTVSSGGALAYKVTITNVSDRTNTNVVFSDPLPQEIFSLISYPDVKGNVMAPVATDHGTCATTGSWTVSSNAVITCQIGTLAPWETVTITFTASILFRSPENGPNGNASPPSNFANKVYVTSDQQSPEIARATIMGASAFVQTLIDVSSDSSAAIEDAWNVAKECAGAIIGTLPGGGLAWGLFGPQIEQIASSPSHNICFTPKSEMQRFVGVGSKEALFKGIDIAGHRMGMGNEIGSRASTAADAAGCTIKAVEAWNSWYQNQDPDGTASPKTSCR